MAEEISKNQSRVNGDNEAEKEEKTNPMVCYQAGPKWGQLWLDPARDPLRNNLG